MAAFEIWQPYLTLGNILLRCDPYTFCASAYQIRVFWSINKQAAARRPAQLVLFRIAVPTTPAQTVSWSIPIVMNAISAMLPIVHVSDAMQQARGIAS